MFLFVQLKAKLEECGINAFQDKWLHPMFPIIIPGVGLGQKKQTTVGTVMYPRLFVSMCSIILVKKVCMCYPFPKLR